MSRLKFYRLLFVLLAVLSMLMIALFSKQLQKSRRRHALNLVHADLRHLTVELSETQRSLVKSPLHFYHVGKNIELLRGIIKSLNEDLENEDKQFLEVASVLASLRQRRRFVLINLWEMIHGTDILFIGKVSRE